MIQHRYNFPLKGTYKTSTTLLCRRMRFASLCQRRVRRILVFFWPLGKQWEQPEYFYIQMEHISAICSKMSCSVHRIIFPTFSLCSFFCLLKDPSDKKIGRTQRFQDSCEFQMNNIGLTIAVHKSEEFQNFCLQTAVFFFLQLIRLITICRILNTLQTGCNTLAAASVLHISDIIQCF